ncbi:ankyrin repeat-containing domain protein [Aspergillus granulosus]|uniref:Ankyrin repeat-containing domain protein n=1 Tax=Aspergillus granulosus TaxID=176169 RepID=A0ABR4GUX5_9EURO
MRLLDFGADTNAREGRYGRTALIWAALKGHAEIVHLLIKSQSTEWETLDGDGRSALWWASEEGHTTVVHELLFIPFTMNTNQLDTLLRRSMLSQAAERGDIAIAMLLLDVESTDPNLRDKDGLVPLPGRHARGGHNDVLSLLLETKRVNIDAQSRSPISFNKIMQEQNKPGFVPSRRKGQNASITCCRNEPPKKSADTVGLRGGNRHP